MDTKGAAASAFEKLTPLAAVILAAGALLSHDYPPLIREMAIGIGALITVVWSLREVAGRFHAIRDRFFPVRLSVDQKIRLSTLLDDVDSFVSLNNMCNPFFVWNAYGERCPQVIRFNREYFFAIGSAIVEMRKLLVESALDNPSMLVAISFSLRNVLYAGQFAGQELRVSLGSPGAKVEEMKLLVKDWNLACTAFNAWMDRWGYMFKEVNKCLGLGCIVYFQPIEPLHI